VTVEVTIAVPAHAIGGLTETLLRAGAAAAVLEHVGDEATLELADGPDIHVVAQIDRARADALVRALDAWLDGVLGPAPTLRRARLELDVLVHPQLPQGNPQVGRQIGVTPVTSWG
jgi:hypothetical protein